MEVKVLAAEDILETVSVEDTLVGSIFAADTTIFGADITLATMAAGPDGTMVTMATGFLVTGFGNGILIMEDG